jgi:hypothetical protein
MTTKTKRKTTPSDSQRIRTMVYKGYSNKAIVEKLGVRPQAVYNIRYQLNKARGLGSIGKLPKQPTDGIGAPPKRRMRAGTGIKAQPSPYVHPAQNVYPIPTLPTELEITMVEPTLWQRIKGWFRG